jgi:hypothetical protein
MCLYSDHKTQTPWPKIWWKSRQSKLSFHSERKNCAAINHITSPGTRKKIPHQFWLHNFADFLLLPLVGVMCNYARFCGVCEAGQVGDYAHFQTPTMNCQYVLRITATYIEWTRLSDDKATKLIAHFDLSRHASVYVFEGSN